MWNERADVFVRYGQTRVCAVEVSIPVIFCQTRQIDYVGCIIMRVDGTGLETSRLGTPCFVGGTR